MYAKFVSSRAYINVKDAHALILTMSPILNWESKESKKLITCLDHHSLITHCTNIDIDHICV